MPDRAFSAACAGRGWRKHPPMDIPSHSRWTCRGGSCSRREPRNEQFFWKELWAVRDTHWSSQFHTVSCAEGPWWSREKGEKEGTTQKNGCGIRQVIMAPLPLHCLGTGRGGRRAENERVKFSFRRKQSSGKVSLIWLCFSPSYSIFC